MAVLRRRPDGSVDEVLPADHSARSAVHEYGGGAWWVHDGVLWFADWATQRLHRRGAGRVARSAHAGTRGARAACATPTVTCTPTAPRSCASRRSTMPTAARPPTRSCASPPTHPARQRWSSRDRTSSRTLAGAPMARRSAGSSGTTPTCPGTPRGSWSTKVGAARWWPAATSGSRSASRCGRRTAPSGSSATARGSGACTGGRRTEGARPSSTSVSTSATPSGCSASRAMRSSVTAGSCSRTPRAGSSDSRCGSPTSAGCAPSTCRTP